MKTARRCSTLLSQLNTSSRGAPTAWKPLPVGEEAPAPEGRKLCHSSVVGAKGVKGTSPQPKCSSSSRRGGPPGTVTSLPEHQSRLWAVTFRVLLLYNCYVQYIYDRSLSELISGVMCIDFFILLTPYLYTYIMTLSSFKHDNIGP